MMFDSLPQDATAMLTWSWSQIEPYYQDLTARPLTAGNVDSWMTDWTRLYERMDEV